MKRLFYIFFIFFLAFSSCRKVIEIIPVVQIQKDMSIAGAGSITHFSFPSADIGFAGTLDGRLYRTTDGGSSWEQLWPSGSKCDGVVFSDVNNGMFLRGHLARITHDGGNTWTSLSGGGNFLEIRKNGQAVIGNYSIHHCSLTCYDLSDGTITGGGSIYNTDILPSSDNPGRVVNDKAFVLTGEGNYFSGYVEGFDLTNGSSISLHYELISGDESPNDIYYTDGSPQTTALVGNYGLITDHTGRNYYSTTRDFYSIDGNGTVMVAVGEKSISTSLDLGTDYLWNEVFDQNGDGFDQTFRRVRFIDDKNLYVSGDNGLFWKMNIW